MMLEPSKPPVYFASSDRQMEAFARPVIFDQSLVFNVLFESQILIPDIYFFVSRNIEAHWRASQRLTLLEAALQEGIAVPAFREGSDFQTALRGIFNQGIGNVLPTARDTADRLQTACERSPRFTSVLWPDNVGGGFDAAVLGALQAPSLPEAGHPDIERYNRRWLAGAPVREDLLTRSLQVAGRRGGSSLRRGDFLEALGGYVGWPADAAMPDSGEILRAIEGTPDYLAIQDLLKVFSECYHVNQASQFACRPSFPLFSPLTQLFLPALGPSPAQLGAPPIRNVVHLDARIPRIHSLIERSRVDLIRIRNEYGVEYRAAVMAWQRCPCADHEERLARSLVGYAETLSKWCGDSRTLRLGVTHISGQDIAWSTAKASAGVAIAAASVPWPLVPVFAAVGAAGSSVYAIARKFWRQHKDVTHIRLAIDTASVSTEVVEREAATLRSVPDGEGPV